jgi:hypothetical protein
MRRYPDSFIEGDGYSRRFADSYAACEQMCIKDVRCTAVEFYRPKTMCNFFNTKVEPGRSKEGEVGIKVAASGGLRPISSGTTAPAATPVSTSPSTQWNHNGSVMRLVAEGPVRRIYYEVPRPFIVASGGRAGLVLFEGRRVGANYTGVAYTVRSKCGRIPYSVAGTVSADQRRIVLTGANPILDATCQVTGYKDDELVFELVE